MHEKFFGGIDIETFEKILREDPYEFRRFGETVAQLVLEAEARRDVGRRQHMNKFRTKYEKSIRANTGEILNFKELIRVLQAMRIDFKPLLGLTPVPELPWSLLEPTMPV